MLTCVVGHPHFGSLQVLDDELKADALSVPSVLFGGFYVNLGLLFTTEHFETLSEEEFNCFILRKAPRSIQNQPQKRLAVE